MQANDQPSSMTSWPQILIVLLLATGAFLVPSPIGPDRPLPSGKGVPTGGMQDIDTRLWQDPFGIVPTRSSGPLFVKSGTETKAVVEVRASAGNPNADRDLKRLAGLIQKRNGTVKVMISLVPGGTWVGADESRRRARYAILAGLNAQGYIPEDPEHIGYAEQTYENQWRAQLPFEWLGSENGLDSVLLLWVDEEAITQEVEYKGKRLIEPLSRLSLLIQSIQASSETKPPACYIVIGPSSSTFFKTALLDPCLGAPGSCIDTLKRLNVHWYSPYATLPDRELMMKTGSGQEGTLTEHLPNFHRMIVSDDLLAKALVKELQRRRFGGGNAVALVGQWDTAYARELRRLLDEEIRPHQKVILVSYLRGLDGRVPGSSENGEKKAPKEQNAADRIERPEGEQQVDYLRRLAAELKAREKELVDGGGTRRQLGRFGAIGILGDDYYDKLMTLKALCPVFPDTLFFTTDLDAAMLLPGDNKFTRNLMVASGYGLSLVPSVQKDIPPFRNVYQTSTFLAVRAAMENANAPGPEFVISKKQIESWLRPFIFEIGRSRAVLLTADEARIPADQGNCTKLADCKNPNPDPHPSPVWYSACVVPLGVLLPLWGLSWLSGFTRRRHTRYWLLTILFSCIGALTLGILFNVGQEPLDWFQGISIWPSVLLRVFTVAVAIYLYDRGRRLLRATQVRVEQKYFPAPTDTTKKISAQPARFETQGWGRNLFRQIFNDFGSIGGVIRQSIFDRAKPRRSADAGSPVENLYVHAIPRGGLRPTES